MLTETNKTVSRRFFEEVFSKGKLAVADEIIAKDHANSGPGTLPGLTPGPEGSKQFVTVYRNAFPDVHFTIDEQIAEGDKVVTRWTAHGTHQGELAGIPATGKSSTVTGIVVDRLVNGKIAESWGIFDQFGMMQQLGVIPMPEIAGK
ncbi:MAG TPA: ester cyclase [Anaerolineales bacterium]|nr:ester cyclase [Anaerolineales bacterium]